MIVRLKSVASTMDPARELPLGSIVVADEQTAGRGRLDRRWEAPRGTGLHATFVVAPHPLTSLAAGVAAADACGRSIRLKWPNDLLLDGKKVGGILVEGGAGRHFVGIGVNLTWAPPGAAQLGVDRDELLDRLAAALPAALAEPLDALLDRWRALAATLGRRVRVELPGGSFEGVAEDIAADGALIVGGRHVHAGDVVHLRDA